MENNKTSILDFDLLELQQYLIDNNFEKFRAKQIFNWIYKVDETSFDKMSNIPKALITFLEKQFCILSTEEIQKQVSQDNETTKFLLSLNDSAKIECVIINSEDRNTLCISSQVGCKLGCQFCKTATMGFIRNLSAAEILSQFLYTRSIVGKIDNIVFMGMGEPLLNYDNVIKAVNILNAKDGVDFGIRRITISTSGIVSGIERLITDNINVKLAVSLNSAIDNKRTQLMPVNKKNKLQDLVNVLKRYQEVSNKRFTFEYVLIKGFNMNKEDANAIIEIAKELSFYLNIIPYNEIENCNFKTPNQKEVDAFVNYFANSNVKIVRRYRKGNDISAACGQLATKFQYPNKENQC